MIKLKSSWVYSQLYKCQVSPPYQYLWSRRETDTTKNKIIRRFNVNALRRRTKRDFKQAFFTCRRSDLRKLRPRWLPSGIFTCKATAFSSRMDGSGGRAASFAANWLIHFWQKNYIKWGTTYENTGFAIILFMSIFNNVTILNYNIVI